MNTPHLSSDLLQCTERELQMRRRRLVFSPNVEARYEADAGPKRARQLFMAGLVALLIYDLFLLNDQLVRPTDLGMAAWLRLGVMTPLGLLALWQIRRGLSARWREIVMASTVTIAVLVSGAIFTLSTSPSARFDPFSFSLIFLAANIVYPLRFAHAATTSVINLLISAAFVMASSQMAPGAQPVVLSLLTGTVVFTLVANYRLEASERRSYLLLLREQLRSEAAAHANEVLTMMSNTDALTQVPNRRRFDDTYAEAWNHAASTGRSLAILMIDIDNFKRYNDRFGHPQGDECLRQVAAAMRRSMRDADFIARFGGEEFAAVLRGADEAEAFWVAERIRTAVADLALPHDGLNGQDIVTVSIGAGVAMPAWDSEASLLISLADQALYAAKHTGRNRVRGATAGSGAVWMNGVSRPAH